MKEPGAGVRAVWCWCHESSRQTILVAEMFQSLFRVPCWRGVTVQVAVWWPGWAGVCGGSVPGLSQPDEAVCTAVVRIMSVLGVIS